MNIGMMWSFDNPQAGLVPNLIEAADYYRQKYGQVPNVCRVHPATIPATGVPQIAGVRDLGGGKWKVGVVTVEPMKEILPKSLWIGYEEPSDGHTNI